MLWVIRKFVRITENIICSFGLIATVVIIFAQVINRYWLHYEIIWMNDLALFIFVITVFISLAITARERANIAVEILQERVLGRFPSIRKVYFVLRSIVSLGVVLILSFQVYKFLLRAIKYPEYGTLIRWFNMSWIVYSFFAMVCLIVFHLVIQIGEDVSDVKVFMREKEA